MPRSALRTLLVFAGMVLFGCSTVPKEKFKEDLWEFSLAENVKMTGLAAVPDPNGKLAEVFRASLRDEKVQEGLYDEALRSGRAWSSEAILDTAWFRLFVHRGLPKLSMQDKDYLLRLVSAKLQTMPAHECAQLHRGRLDVGRTLRAPPGDDEHFYQVVSRVVKAGAIADSFPQSKKDKEDFGVALVALFAKAKETMQEEELRAVMLPVVEQNSATDEAACRTSKALMALILQLDPEYRSAIFNSWVK